MQRHNALGESFTTEGVTGRKQDGAIYPLGRDHDGHCIRCGIKEENPVVHDCPKGFRMSVSAPGKPERKMSAKEQWQFDTLAALPDKTKAFLKSLPRSKMKAHIRRILGQAERDAKMELIAAGKPNAKPWDDL